ncbi:uncharacterized protein LOC107637195 [Arachis ipaensis]|uniref:Uncharacterized protein n=1 Tax=Arachis hypogaea TaxID=3818 RepID=A0A444ZQU4_ARAHY|nr:uncharacterized protein LOC107637195 [Arachis ipaensis]RYR16537.1 hypothetical protein Ahy_B04g073582 [Arachis hypogaea]
MSNSSGYLVVYVYPNCLMKNGDNGVVFECEKPVLLRTRRVASLLELKSLILRNVDGSGRKEVGRVCDRLLASMGNGVFRFRLFWLYGDEHVRLMFDIHGRIMAKQVMELSAEVGDVGGDGFGQSDFVQDDPPFAPPLIHVASLLDYMDVDGEEFDEDYVADSNDSDSSEDDDEEFVPDTPIEPSRRYLLSAPRPILALSLVPSHYHTLDMDAIQEKNPFSNTGEDDYNLDEELEFSVGHILKSRDAVLQGVKNYSIRRSAEYRVLESDRLKYHVRCQQHESGCPLSLRVALRHNLGYW